MCILQARVWQLTDSRAYPVSLLCELSGLHSDVISGLDLSSGRVLTKDSAGSAVIWDLEEAVAVAGGGVDNSSPSIEVRRVKARPVQVSRCAALALSERQWALGLADISNVHCPVVVSDIWRTEQQNDFVP